MAARHASARTKARKQALDILFEADLRGTDPLEVLAGQREVTDAEMTVRPFAIEIIEGISAEADRVDALIGDALSEGWSLARMPRVDRNLARIAVWEIISTDAADEVSISEAVGLARSLSTDDSPAFLTGVLNAVSRRSRTAG